MAQPLEKKRYTYEDYLTWDGDYELIYGVPYPKYGSHPYEPHSMAGVSRAHQKARRQIEFQFSTYLEGKSCQLFSETFDVFLYNGEEDEIVVQPDILVVCDPQKIQKNGCEGAPDLIVEVLSPSTFIKDKTEKLLLYEKSGVREYWIVDTNNHVVYVHILEDGRYGHASIYKEPDAIPVHVLKECNISLVNVFENIPI